MTQHYTAWINTDPSVLSDYYADVTVLRNESNRDDPDSWTSVGDPVDYFPTTILATTDDQDSIITYATERLSQLGWNVVGKWRGVTTGCVATVERA